MSKKGITDIIAIVLLLMITISMIGFAWLWFNRLAGNAMNKTDAQLSTASRAAGQLVLIDNIAEYVGSVNVTIRNAGTYDIPFTLMSFYANGNSATCSTPSSATLSVGSTLTCNITAVNTATCQTIMVSAPGNKDSVSCA